MYTYQFIDSFENRCLQQLNHYLESFIPSSKELLFLCIGTPYVIGDALGPLIGSLIKQNTTLPVYGTLEEPVHALNLKDYLQKITKRHPDSYVIAIDSALSKVSNEGFIALKNGPLFPGKGVGKKLPPVGNLEFTGILHKLNSPYALELISHLATQMFSAIWFLDTQKSLQQ